MWHIVVEFENIWAKQGDISLLVDRNVAGNKDIRKPQTFSVDTAAQRWYLKVLKRAGCFLTKNRHLVKKYNLQIAWSQGKKNCNWSVLHRQNKDIKISLNECQNKTGQSGAPEGFILFPVDFFIGGQTDFNWKAKQKKTIEIIIKMIYIKIYSS